MKCFFGALLFFLTFTFQTACQNSSPSNQELFHLIREPKVNLENGPLLFLLNGYGSNEKDLFSFSAIFPDSFMVVSIRAPKNISDDGFSWYDLYRQDGVIIHNVAEAEKSRIMLAGFIENFIMENKVDRKKIYLCGFSQGAIMSFSLGLSMPDKFRGIIALSGKILDETKVQLPEISKFNKFDVLLIHGTDDKVIPVDFARAARDFLNEQKILLTYEELSLGHTISNETLNIILNWLSKNK
jgi:phospholipase/carboxylesterase